MKWSALILCCSSQSCVRPIPPSAFILLLVPSPRHWDVPCNPGFSTTRVLSLWFLPWLIESQSSQRLRGGGSLSFLPAIPPTCVCWAAYWEPFAALCTGYATESKAGWSAAWGGGQIEGNVVGAGAARSTVLRGCWGGEEHSAPRVLRSSPWSWDEGAAQVNFSHPTPFPVDPLKFVKYLISIPFSIPTLLFVLSKYFQAH